MIEEITIERRYNGGQFVHFVTYVNGEYVGSSRTMIGAHELGIMRHTHIPTEMCRCLWCGKEFNKWDLVHLCDSIRSRLVSPCCKEEYEVIY